MAGYAESPPDGDSEHRPESSQRFPKRDRLTKSGEFTFVYDNGRKFVGRFMVLWAIESPESRVRVGVVAGRKTGNSVARSRAKRRLRELFRRNREWIQKPVDLVLVARRPIVQAPWNEVLNEYRRLVHKAGLNL